VCALDAVALTREVLDEADEALRAARVKFVG
jgi:hypothetical protein